AVEGAESPDQVDGVDTDHLAGGEETGEDVERVAVAPVVERGYEHHIVGDIEVGVAGREALAVHHHGARKRQFHHTQAAGDIARGELEPAEVVRRGFV